MSLVFNTMIKHQVHGILSFALPLNTASWPWTYLLHIGCLAEKSIFPCEELSFSLLETATVRDKLTYSHLGCTLYCIFALDPNIHLF